MPAFEHGGIAIRPCGGWAPAPALQESPSAHAHGGHHGAHTGRAPAPDEEHHHQDKHQTSDQPCSFAGALLAWTDDGRTSVVLPFIAASAAVASFATAPAPGRGLAAPPPPATGPPMLA
jgi:hypothetical protein